MFDKIEAEIEKIRPYIQNDGGDIQLVDYEDGIVYVRLYGACVGCPSSYITLKAGIEHALKQEFPEIKGVEQV
jgi:Fe-S cluster biogenesis protein NfuA